MSHHIHTARYASNQTTNWEYLSNEIKRDASLHADSLYSMAMALSDDCDVPVHSATSCAPLLPRATSLSHFSNNKVTTCKTPAVFHPIDEYKDLSLGQILDMADGFLDQTPAYPLGNDSLMFPDLPCSRFNATNEMATERATRTDREHQEMFLSLSGNTFVGDLPVSVQPLSNNAHPSLNAPSTSQQMLSSVPSSLLKKRGRSSPTTNDSDDFNDEEQDRRFRPYQSGQWNEKYAELCEFKKQTGHCLVPHSYNDNLPLARWVKRQRYQYKLMKDGKASTMTPERAIALDEIGFVWDSQAAAWGERLDELKEFRKEFGHCNVPSNYANNTQLATWVKCQRRQYKLYTEGQPSNITAVRIDELEGIGFEWEIRPNKKARSC